MTIHLIYGVRLGQGTYTCSTPAEVAWLFQREALIYGKATECSVTKSLYDNDKLMSTKDVTQEFVDEPDYLYEDEPYPYAVEDAMELVSPSDY